MPDDIPADTSTSAALQLGQSATSQFEAPSDVDWWRVVLTPGLSYLLDTPLMEAGFYDAAGNPVSGLINSDLYGQAAISVTTAGTYYVGLRYGVVGDNPTYPISYTTKLTLNDTIVGNATTSAVLPNNVLVRGTIDTPTDHDWYKVSFEAGMSSAIQINQDDEIDSGSITVTIRDASGNILTSMNSDDDFRAQALWEAAYTGTYYVDVSGHYNEGYTLEAVLTDKVAASAATTSILTVGASVTSRLDTLGDEDWHAFSVDAGQSYTFTFSGARHMLARNVQILDSTGKVLGVEGQSWTAGFTGWVYLSVKAIDTQGFSEPLVINTQGFFEPSGRDYSLSVSSNAGVIKGTIGNDVLRGGEGNNEMFGLAGHDLLEGYGGNDRLNGQFGNDTLNGGAGNDVLVGGAGDDVLNGGAGIDTANYQGLTAVKVDLRITEAQNTGLGNDRLSGIENLVGGSMADRLTGDLGDKILNGLLGNDTLDGGAGNDTLVGGLGDDVLMGGTGIDTAAYYGTTAVRVDLAISTAQATGQGRDVLTGIESLISGSGNDTLMGNSLMNRLTGGAGNDLLEGRGGNDTLIGGLGNDTLDGGASFDAVDYSGTTAVRVDLRLTGPQDTGLGRDTILNIENVIGGSGNDALLGNAQRNTLQGGDGNDAIKGFAGNDVLWGGSGSDLLTGGEGNDTLIGGAGYDRFIFDSSSGSDVIRDFDRAADLIVISNGAESWSDLHITSSNANAIVTFASTSITLLGVAAYNLDASDFVFI